MPGIFLNLIIFQCGGDPVLFCFVLSTTEIISVADSVIVTFRGVQCGSRGGMKSFKPLLHCKYVFNSGGKIPASFINYIRVYLSTI